jgi:DNA-binding IclR family transcriptional regulator
VTKHYVVPSLARAFEILDMLSMSSVGLTKMEIAQSIKIPYSTAFNLLNTMEQFGYVRKDEQAGKYYLGLKLISLGSIQIKEISLRDTAAPVLEELVRETGMTVHLAILDRGEAVYIDKREPDGFLKINSWIGKRNHIHTSAVGKILAAHLPADEVDAICRNGLLKRTNNSVVSIKKFKQVLAEAQARGYAVDVEEDEVGGRCVAAPIRNAAGSVVAAVGVSGIASQVPDPLLHKLGELVSDRAGQISSRLGYSPSRSSPAIRHS